MAFLIHMVDNGNCIPPYEYVPCSAITPKVGMALKFTSGKLAICSGTTKPEYISMREEKSAVTAGDLIPVIRVTPDIVFEVEADTGKDLSAINIGTKVTIATSGMAITDTTTSGVAEIVEKLSATKARIRFS